MITDDFLLVERRHPNKALGGVQRIYRFPNGNGLSLVNSSSLHPFPFAWEVAVLENVSEDGKKFTITYDTELTEDVEVFETEEDTNEFIERAIALFAH